MTTVHLAKEVGEVFKVMLPLEAHFLNLLKNYYETLRQKSSNHCLTVLEKKSIFSFSWNM